MGDVIRLDPETLRAHAALLARVGEFLDADGRAIRKRLAAINPAKGGGETGAAIGEKYFTDATTLLDGVLVVGGALVRVGGSVTYGADVGEASEAERARANGGVLDT